MTVDETSIRLRPVVADDLAMFRRFATACGSSTATRARPRAGSATSTATSVILRGVRSGSVGHVVY